MRQSQIVINSFPLINSKRHTKSKNLIQKSNNAGSSVWIEEQRGTGKGLAFKFFSFFLAKFPPLELENWSHEVKYPPPCNEKPQFGGGKKIPREGMEEESKCHTYNRPSPLHLNINTCK